MSDQQSNQKVDTSSAANIESEVPQQQNIGSVQEELKQEPVSPVNANLDKNKDSSADSSDNVPINTSSEPLTDFSSLPSVSIITDDSGRGETAYIVRDREDLVKMLDEQKKFSGKLSNEQIQMELSSATKNINAEDDVKRMVLPAEKFIDFKEVHKENEEEFEYVIACIVTQFLEKFEDTALEFPSCIDGAGRAQIHAICNFLGMASHSISSGKNRRIMIYPKHLYIEKQAKEAKDREKEKEKILSKLKDSNFPPHIPPNPVSTRDRLMKECWHEVKGLPKPVFEEVWQGPIDIRIAELKKKMQLFEENAHKQKIEYDKQEAKKLAAKQSTQEKDKTSKKQESKGPAKSAKVQGSPYETGKTQPFEVKFKAENKGEELKEGEVAEDKEDPTKIDSDLDIDSDELDDEYFEMCDEDKKAYREKRERIKKAKYEDFKRRENLLIQLKEFNLETFKDKPDAINSHRCVHVEGKMFVVEWDTPAFNNSPIQRYNVYLASKKIKINQIGGDQNSSDQRVDLVKIATIEDPQNQRFYEFTGLEVSTCYYIVVTAENGFGEGYKAAPFMVRTLPRDIDTESSTLYVWGSNINSEIGLTDDQVLQNISFYQKNAMKKVIRQTCFKNNTVAQVATGNVSTMFLVVDLDKKYQTIVMSGLTTITKDEKSRQTVFTPRESETLLDTISSIPYGLDFNIPVAKIICGDTFAGLLTATGEVYTWGWNLHGQLGLKDTSIGVTLNPMRVDFQSKDKIMDIACGFNNTIALTDQKQIYVWGKRMGIYPSFDFCQRAIEEMAPVLLRSYNQDTPRLIKENLRFYNISKIVAGQTNSGLITESGELLLQGMNTTGQLGIGGDQEYLSQILFFFPQYMKKDYFTEKNLLVLDVSFGLEHTLVLCQDKATKKNRVFGCGHSNLGQLCNVTQAINYQFAELTQFFPDEIVQISAGSLHSLFLTKTEGKVYGCGKNSKGQLGFKSESSNNLVGQPVEVKIGTAADKLKVNVLSVHSGSLYSMALARTQIIQK